ncbi:type I-E CRISPR-associated protein Cse1/CasA [Limosilactobacillus kribbianus]|uniref:type I-E CRISPR-associated protein Cse1/CasA n=1 Tax=Limosilactobacillus kribbianus TaxID=2982695 RepID=UPI002265008C|nr:type I-E CRISPR-associated protein Cse1/CasA [Limosilactobacillus kribbianus]
MDRKHFSLVTEPWIKVIDENNREQEISLETLFRNAAQYRQLAGEMKSQDLAILRFLLAILTTVYSRYSAEGQVYKWQNIDEKSFKFQGKRPERDLLATWENLYNQKKFTSELFEYLQSYANRFDLLDAETPFYQVTREEYDSLVPKTKSVGNGKGTVAVKQINRTISESNNKPDIFSPNAPLHKDDVSFSELTRWLITYQNFTAVTDKTKVKSKEKFSVSKGWLYDLDPVFAVGNNLFETLMLNLVLVPQSVRLGKNVFTQRPAWELPALDYIQLRLDNNFPQNIAQLYTTWSRAIHIEWNGNRPTIFSAGLPKLDNEDAFLEPMTTWKVKDKEPIKPTLRWLNSLGRAMWRNFGQYISTQNSNGVQPGIVAWLNNLQSKNMIQPDFSVHLATVGLINDGNATSQSPAAEFADEMRVNADVLFDKDLTDAGWPTRIEETVVRTQKLGLYLSYFAKNVANLRGLSPSVQTDFANQVTAEYYSQLNVPFYEWLASLSSQDERSMRINEWNEKAAYIVMETGQKLLNTATPREIRGQIKDEKLENIFIDYRIFKASVMKTIKNG